METKAHSRDTYKTAGQISWIEQDLLDCSGDLESLCRRVPFDENSNEGRDNNFHVCIVGAGFAGLRCAEVLLGEGVRVTILEARDRLGGRAYQTDLRGHVVDMGPNWIHGTLTNPIVHLAKKTDTALCLIEDSMNVFDQCGQAIDSEKADSFFELVWSIISEAFKYSNKECSRISPKTSLKDFFTEKISERDFNNEDRTLILQMAEMWGAFIGDPWDKQSLKYFWLEECLDGAENFFVTSSHAGILYSVAERASKQADIHQKTKVLGIETIVKEGNCPKVLIKTEDQVLEFDEVVVTAPLGCLKRQDVHFIPPLPTPIIKAIKNTAYSTLEKVYITFQAAFWDVPTSTSAPFSSFAHFLHPTYSPNNPNSWTLELNALSSPELFGTHAQPTLLFTIYGPCAIHITSLINRLSPSSPEYFTTLDEFFRPYYALLPNYTLEDSKCQAIAALATNWQNDPLAGCGSYMNFQVSEEIADSEAEVKLDEDIRALRRGLPERGVWFAGEHTAPFVALGTLTGAYWSGEAVGVRILKAHGLDGRFWRAEVE
ncbi:amine oxidase [Bisporella sp. PMI_857]|nr:amine oxidase [Bisporella sp. PMI_857]